MFRLKNYFNPKDGWNLFMKNIKLYHIRIKSCGLKVEINCCATSAAKLLFSNSNGS